jgi:acyl-CoA synthetase (AMP-forming)/AMP-acid ligase II/thioesterase domain-containing protein/acyl carrier protein
VALAAPGRPPLSYGRFAQFIGETADALRGLGVGRGQRVALALPNGPEAASAFVAIASCAVCAPLNPAYTESELDFCLSDLGAAALVVPSGAESAATVTARARGIAIIELSVAAGQEAGVFRLTGAAVAARACGDFPEPDETALVLHTSGTTSRPKLVPLTHRNLCASAAHTRAALELRPSDCCLNVMPLFHVHGLVGAVLSSLAAGASVVCTPGLQAPRFYEWLEEFRPSWYTAVPTMHQAILVRAAAHGEVIRRSRLRLVRSCSAALPPQVASELENVFGVPVIEAYGMTEAAHQMASDPLSPRARKPGSVGIAAGPEIAILGETGEFLPAEGVGEIVIRGPNVTAGYEKNPAANQSAFFKGWFRTGDQGYLDGEGYLFVTGRLKEIINRGGEKVSPREVEEALLDHPAVAQVVAFALPDARLGEEVAAAVVPRPGASATESDLRAFAARRLADFKVPRRVLIVSEIPKGATGKLQRVGLAEKLGLAATAARKPAAQGSARSPRNPLEQELARIWAEVLEVPEVGIGDDFFQLGGDSLTATLLAIRVTEALGRTLPLLDFLDEPTVAGMAARIAGAQHSATAPSVMAIQPHGEKPSLFCLGGHTGNLLGFCNLARHLGPDQPVFGLSWPEAQQEPAACTVEALAANCIENMRAQRVEGPYLLAGFCFGGLVAFEMARQLEAQGEWVALLALLDCYNPAWSTALRRTQWWRLRGANFLRRLAFHARNLSRLGLRGKAGYISAAVRRLAENLGRQARQLAYNRLADAHLPLPRGLKGASYARWRAAGRYRPWPWPGGILSFRASAPRPGAYADPHMGWRDLAAGGVTVQGVPGDNLGMLREPQVQAVARAIAVRLKEAEGSGMPAVSRRQG